MGEEVSTEAKAEVFRFGPLNEVRGYLVDEGYPTGSYKELFPDQHFACSKYREIGPGPLTSTLAYYIDGTPAGEVQHAYLTLNLNHPSHASDGAAELVRSGAAMVKRATGVEMPGEVRHAIETAAGGAWQVGGATVKLVRTDFPTGKGYSLKLLVE